MYSMLKITVSRCMYTRQVLLHQVTRVSIPLGVAKLELGYSKDAKVLGV